LIIIEIPEALGPPAPGYGVYGHICLRSDRQVILGIRFEKREGERGTEKDNQAQTANSIPPHFASFMQWYTAEIVKYFEHVVQVHPARETKAL